MSVVAHTSECPAAKASIGGLAAHHEDPAREPPGRTCGDHRTDGLLDLRRADLARFAQAGRKVERADEHRADARHRNDLADVRDAIDVLHLRDHNGPVVIAGDGVSDAVAVALRARHSEAAPAGRWIRRRPHDRPRLSGGVHVRHDDPGGARVERFCDQDRLVVRDAHDTRAQVTRGLHDALHGGEVEEAVLHVHEQPVEPGCGHDFRHLRRRQRQHRAEQRLAPCQPGHEPVLHGFVGGNSHTWLRAQGSRYRLRLATCGARRYLAASSPSLIFYLLSSIFSL